MKVTKITIGRLYNLGNYEHVRYDITVDVQPGESAASAMIGLEKIITGLAPERAWAVHSEGELEREGRSVEEMSKLLVNAEFDETEFRRRHGHFEGTPREYYKRCLDSHQSNVTRRAKAVQRAATARKLLEDIGGAANWKDAKLDWQDDFGYED